MPSIEAILRMTPGFDELSSPVLEHLAAVVDIVEAPQGEVLFREGAVPKSLYILLEGRVSPDQNGGQFVERGHRYLGTRRQLRSSQRAHRRAVSDGRRGRYRVAAG